MRRVLLLLALPCLPALAETGPSPEQAKVEVDDPKLKADIEDCIRRGVTWLKGRQEPSGAWPGLDPGPVYAGGSGTPYDDKYELSALALLALLKCDVPLKDPCIVQGFAWLQKNATSLSSYGPAIALMALEAKYAPKEAVTGRDGKRKARKPKPLQLAPEDTLWAGKLVTQLLGAQHACGGWRYGGLTTPLDMEGGKPGVADVSATQYALLGMNAARHLGIPVPPEPFYKAAGFLMDQQEAEGKRTPRITERARAEQDNPRVEGEEAGEEAAGDYGKDRIRGWPYMKGNIKPDDAAASASMTCAGIVGIMVCRNACMDDKGLKKPDKEKRLAGMKQAVWDGLAWLDAHWSVSENIPKPQHYELGYYLYALERVGIMTDLRDIGPGHDWYLQGARVWTSSMQKEGDDKGYWAISHGRAKIETQDTPYGLLFLRKAVLLSYPIGEAE